MDVIVCVNANRPYFIRVSDGGFIEEKDIAVATFFTDEMDLVLELRKIRKENPDKRYIAITVNNLIFKEPPVNIYRGG